MDPDRHGRIAHTDTDRRRRPVDGFRLRTAARFRQMTAEVLADLPPAFRSALEPAQVEVRDVPPPGEVALVSVTTRGGRVHRLIVHRRPLEVRALNRADLVGLLRASILHELATSLGLDPGDEAP